MASLECEPLESKLQVNVFPEHHSMALLEKKSRTVWTIYEKWSVVEPLLTAFILKIAYIKDKLVVVSEKPYRLYIKDSLN